MEQIRFNIGTPNGQGLIKRSLQELGCGRSVLADKNGTIIAGISVFDIATGLGKKIKVVEATADELVIVKRVDLEADSCTGKELAFIDNFSQEKNLNWDANALLAEMNRDWKFDPRKWGGNGCLVKELDIHDLFKENAAAAPKSTKRKTEDLLDFNQPSLFDLDY